MKRSSLASPALLGLVLLALAFSVAFPAAEERQVTLPKGTTAESPEQGNWIFTLPTGYAVQVKGFVASGKGAADSGTLRECSFFEKGKLIAMGERGTLRTGPQPAGDITVADSMKVAGKVVWLPAALTFKTTRIFSRLSFTRVSAVVEPPAKS